MSVFEQEGTSNVSWTWTMTDWAFKTTDERAADNWYPGDDVVDVIGADAYNFSDCMTAGLPWSSLRSDLVPIRAWGQSSPWQAHRPPGVGNDERPTGRWTEGILDPRCATPAEEACLAKGQDGSLLPNHRPERSGMRVASHCCGWIRSGTRRHGGGSMFWSKGMRAQLTPGRWQGRAHDARDPVAVEVDQGNLRRDWGDPASAPR